MPADLVDRLDRLAAQRGTSRNRIIIEACQSALDAARGEWPDSQFAANIDPDDLRVLRDAGAEMEKAIYASRRDRRVPPL